MRTPVVKTRAGRELKLIPSSCRSGLCTPSPWRGAPLAFHREHCSSHQVQEEHLDASSLATLSEGDGLVEEMCVDPLKPL